jgi:(p)ppGpp synthase/HD superfamily hydrolase
MNPNTAHTIAFVAHSACGQYRADGVTPYIWHPERVADLVVGFSRFNHTTPQSVIDNRIVGALLHDVLEDTKLSETDLVNLGITSQQLDIVKRLTKPNPGPAPASYYNGIASSLDALYVKCADRCANLEDAYAELLVEEPRTPRRWGRYVEKTYTDVLPLYSGLPKLALALETRLHAIEKALPAALQRRAAMISTAGNVEAH